MTVVLGLCSTAHVPFVGFQWNVGTNTAELGDGQIAARWTRWKHCSLAVAHPWTTYGYSNVRARLGIYAL